MTGERIDDLRLPLTVQRNQDGLGTAFTVSVDAASGTTTGLSAADRAITIRALAEPASAARVPLITDVTPDNRRCLEAKENRLGHLLDPIRAVGGPRVTCG